jgi:hypothetical protein
MSIIATDCGPSEIRTRDLLNAIETRSQLRYGPIENLSNDDWRLLNVNNYAQYIFFNSQSTIMVDLRGFEPLASSVRLRRAPNCATGPFLGERYST